MRRPSHPPAAGATLALVAALLLAACSAPAPGTDATEPTRVDQTAARQAVAAVLDDWHDAASKADAERYFGHFAADGVFLGTDPSERWTVEEFRAYAEPYFSAGRGWTYVPSRRHIALSPAGDVAWVDEQLDNEKYGELRGTAVLRREGDAWRIVLYSMTFLIPNDEAPTRGGSRSPGGP